MLEIETSEKGAELISVKLNNIEKLHDGKTFWNRHSPVLFPIVGKLKDGKTTIDGKIYEMGQHGFIRAQEFPSRGRFREAGLKRHGAPYVCLQHGDMV